MKKITTKKWLRVSVILYVVILTMVVIASFAWFVFDDTATLQTSNNMVITSGNKLEIALRDATNTSGEFGSVIQFVTDVNFSYPDITGTIDSNGDLIFYYPQALNENDEPLYDEPDTFKQIDLSDAEASASYLITVKLSFRTTVPMDVYLSADSFVNGMTSFEDFIGTDSKIAGNNSPYGNFSRDAIAGAARVAFLEDTGDALLLKNIWIPNEKYELKYIPENEASKAQKYGVVTTDENGRIAIFGRDGVQEELNKIGGLARYETLSGERMEMTPFGTLQYVENDPSYPGMGKYLNRLITLGNASLASKDTQTSVPMVNNAAPLLSFTAEEIRAKNGSCTKNLTIYIWIEGTDREADKATVGGKLKYKFDFVGIQKEECAYSVDNIEYSGNTLTYVSSDGQSAPSLQYSENGIDWKTYDGSSLKLSEGIEKFYVRIAETNNAKASTHKEFSTN